MTAQLSFDESFEACGVCERGWLERRNSHCNRCHLTWAGADEAHCAVCCAHFLSVEAFDAHLGGRKTHA